MGTRRKSSWAGEEDQRRSEKVQAQGQGPLVKVSRWFCVRHCSRKGDAELKYTFPEVKGTYILVWLLLHVSMIPM